MQVETERVVGVDCSIPNAVRSELIRALTALGFDPHALRDPHRWLASHPSNSIAIAIPLRTHGYVEVARRTAPGAMIIGVCAHPASASTHRSYLNAGATGIIGTNLPPGDLVHVLAATLRGFVVLPPLIAQAIASRLADIPGDIYLTGRDKQLLGLIARRSSPSAIAPEIGCSERHLRRITADLLRRIGAVSRPHAAALATQWGLAATIGRAPPPEQCVEGPVAR